MYDGQRDNYSLLRTPRTSVPEDVPQMRRRHNQQIRLRLNGAGEITESLMVEICERCIAVPCKEERKKVNDLILNCHGAFC